MKSKRGTLIDYLKLTPVILSVVFIIIISMQLGLKIESSIDLTHDESDAVLAEIPDAVNIMDYVGFGLWIFLLLGSALFALFVRSNPIFYWLNIPFVIMLVGLSVLYANVYDMFITNPGLAEAAAEAQATTFIFSNLPWFTTIYAVVILVIMTGLKFSKPRRDEEIPEFAQ